MFQFTGLPSHVLWHGWQGMSPAGFLHSDICGSMAICASPQLFAACRVLLRQISPRHPPYALSILTYGTYFVCVHLDLLAFEFPSVRKKHFSNEIFLTLLLYSFQRTILLIPSVLPEVWWRWGESNSWPPACKAGALPAELHPHMKLIPVSRALRPLN